MTDQYQQKDIGFMTYPSQGWHKAMFKAPVLLWRLGLGSFIGQMMVLITQTGRKSGLPRRTVTEVHELNGRKYAPAAFGRRAQWYLNIEADPLVTIQTADGIESARAVRVTEDQELLELVHQLEAPSDTIMALYLDTLDIEPNDEDIVAKKDRIYWVRFDPTDELTPPPQASDLIWVWPVLVSAVVTGLVMLVLNRLSRKK